MVIGGRALFVLVTWLAAGSFASVDGVWPSGAQVGCAGGDRVEFTISLPNGQGDSIITITGGVIDGSPITVADVIGSGPNLLKDEEDCATKCWKVTLANGEQHLVTFNVCKQVLQGSRTGTVGAIKARSGAVTALLLEGEPLAPPGS